MFQFSVSYKDVYGEQDACYCPWKGEYGKQSGDTDADYSQVKQCLVQNLRFRSHKHKCGESRCASDSRQSKIVARKTPDDDIICRVVEYANGW